MGIERERSGMVPDEAVNDQGNVTEDQRLKRAEDERAKNAGDNQDTERDGSQS